MRPFKRSRRFGRRTVKGNIRRRWQRVIASTAQWGKPYGGLQFRKKRLSKRHYRSILWRDTVAKAHYRSYAHLALTSAGALPTGFGNGLVYMRPAITVDDAIWHTAPFWLSTGGAQQIDASTPVPLFRGDVTLRGGFSRLTTTNPDSGVPVRIKVFGVWANQTPSTEITTRLHGNSFAMEWDPSVEADFYQFGRVIMRREVTLLPGAQPFEVSYRHRVQKIDQNTFIGENPFLLNVPAGSQLWWVWQMIPLVNNAAADAVSTLLSFNLSFSADAIGTT